MPEEDFHLPDHARSQAHECGRLRPLSLPAQRHAWTGVFPQASRSAAGADWSVS
jgi:hypothetical protein